MTSILPAASLIKDKLQFVESDGFERTRCRGAFYLRHPDRWDFQASITLAKNYYLEPNGSTIDDYRGFRSKNLGKSLLGYSQTRNDQDELLQIECGLWREYFPKLVADLLWAMNKLSRATLAPTSGPGEIRICTSMMVECLCPPNPF